MNANITTLRLQMRRNGFHPLPLEGKAPHMTGWQQKLDVSEDEIRLWEKSYHLAHNTGILAKFAPGLDIDIKIEAAAKAAEEKAREFLEERGDIHVRFGLAPKRLIPLRTDEPFAKMYRILKAPDGTEHKIEFLGEGQQYVVHGIHPDTHKPYTWFGGDLETIKRENLPYVRREDAEQILDAITEVLVENHGFTLTPSSKGQTNGGGGQTFNGDAGAREKAFAAAALKGCMNELVSTNAGNRNEKLNAVAFRLGRMIARGWIERAAVEHALIGAMHCNGAIADDGLKAAKVH
jgi:hypothetical protein